MAHVGLVNSLHVLQFDKVCSNVVSKVNTNQMLLWVDDT